MSEIPIIFIVEDDAAVRAAIALLVTSCGWHARPFDSAERFLEAYSPVQPACLVVDLQMPRVSGADLLETLARLGSPLPAVVVTAFPEHSLAARARSAGARAVLAKPFRDEDLLGEIRACVEPVLR